MATANETLRYFFNESKNRILVSSSKAGANNSLSIMNAELTSSHLTFFDSDLVSKLTTVGTSMTYTVQNGTADTTVIPIEPDQELWVYKGYSPGTGDGNYYRYNPYLHRPYKAYIVTTTGSGVPTSPWLQEGNDMGYFANGLPGQSILNGYGEKTLAAVGNFGQPFGGTTYITTQSVSMSFEVFRGGTEGGSSLNLNQTKNGRNIHPFILTQYPTISPNLNTPIYGSAFSLYKEQFPGGAVYTRSFNKQNSYTFDPATSVGNPGTTEIKFNNATIASSTTASIGNLGLNSFTLLGLSASLSAGKSGSIDFVITGSTGNNTVTLKNIAHLEYKAGQNFWEMHYDNVTSTAQPPFSPGESLLIFQSGSVLIETLLQGQTNTQNTVANSYSGITLNNGVYSVSSSLFQAGTNNAHASGSSQFGLYADYDTYVRYNTTNFTGNTQNPVRVNFTASDGSSRFFDLQTNQVAGYRALAGSVSFPAPGTGSQSDFSHVVANPSVPGVSVIDSFSTRWENVYISYSSSLSSSLDGIYTFNQPPQNDVQVTASALLNAWTGEAVVGANYGGFGYGGGNYGKQGTTPGTTWQTASILIFTGSNLFPSEPPKITDTPYTTSMFRSATIHTTPLSVTMSFLIPSQSISLKDCLSMALKVESGSANSASVENSLVVSDYSLKFFTPTQSEEGDGRVPTFIDNAFSGSSGFSNAPDCQPLLNNINADRTNPQIQEVDYNTSAYNPSNWQAILSGSAQQSTIPESYYTLARQINPRYDGSRSQAESINSVVGLQGGFGVTPVIDYETAYFAYCNQIYDLYPVLNNKTLFNVKYLINDSGDAKQPQLSPYTAFDVEGSWDEGGIGRVGLGTVSGSTQFNALNNFQTINKVTAEPTPVLYSQTSAGTFSTVLPLQGNPDEVSNFNAEFLNYNSNVIGANFNSTYNNSKYISTSLTDELTLPVSASLWNVTTASRFGLSGSNGVVYANPNIFLTSSTSVTNNNYGSFGLPGDVFFPRDAFNNSVNTEPFSPSNKAVTGTNNNLSSVYKYKMTVQIPSSVPVRFRYDEGGWNDSSDYTNEGSNNSSRQIIGDIKIYMQYNYGTAGNWSTVPIEPLAAPSITYYWTGGQQRTYDLENMVGASRCRFVPSGNGGYFQLDIHEKFMTQVVRNSGLEPHDAIYATYNFSFQNTDDHIIKATRRYRWFSQRTYKQEPVDADRNYWNPTATAQVFGQMPIVPPVKGPFINAALVSDQSSGTQQDNAVNAPFWYFSQSNNIGPETYNFTNSIVPTNPGFGNILVNSANPTTVTSICLSTSSYYDVNLSQDFSAADSLGSNVITITKGSDKGTFMKYNVTNWTPGGTGNQFYTLTTTFLETSSNFPAGSSWTESFSGTGSVLNSASVFFQTGAAFPNDVSNTLLLSSSNANTAYANGYYQSYLPYTASLNPVFPGGMEPADADFPQNNIEWEVFPGDELRFENLESKVYTVQRVIPPSENVDAATQIGQLKLEFTQNIPPGLNMDFFLLRRYRYSPNSIIIDKQFPYGGLPIVKEFVPSTNSTTNTFGTSSGTPVSPGVNAYSQSLQTSTQSGSIVEIYAPLTIAANTPSGFLFPEFPTADIELDPDVILTDLRDKKLIE